MTTMMEAAEKLRTSLSPVSGTYLLGAARALGDLLQEAAPSSALRRLGDSESESPSG